MKKYLKITLVILLIAAIGVGAYYWYARRAEVEEFFRVLFPPSEQVEREVPEEEVVVPALTSPSDTVIFDYWIHRPTGAIYLVGPTGQVTRLNGENGEELVNSQNLPGLNKIKASYDGEFAVAKLNYPRGTTFSVFSAETGGWQALPQGTIAAAWAPDTHEVAYLDRQGLKILNLDSGASREVTRMSQTDADLHWQLPTRILLINNLDTHTAVYTINPQSGAISLLLEETGLLALWPQEGEFGIKFNSSARGTSIRTHLIDENGTVADTFTFVTLPEKCTTDEFRIYCAIPRNIPEGTRLPNDYQKHAIYFDDALYLIDLETGGFAELPLDDPEMVIDAKRLTVHNGKLYFQNRLDDLLYSLTLE